MADHERRENVGYDEYSGRFFFETKVESLERVSRQKNRHASIMNRSSSKQLENEQKLIKSARDIMESKMMRDIHSARQSLKDMVSYRTVLQKIAQKNGANPWHPESLGKYGVGASYFELSDKRDKAKDDMDPMTRRRMASRTLLEQRKPVEVMDRNLDDDALFDSWHKRSRSYSPASKKKKKDGPNRTAATLKLPPIAATKMVPKSVVDKPDTSASVFITSTEHYA